MTGKKITGITILLLIILTTPALAASAGVSPASIKLNATQGESYTINFAAVNTGNDTTSYSIYARGNITNWTYFNTTKITLAGKKAYVTDAIITIPKDIPDGSYRGDIIIKSIPDSSTGGNKISVAVNLPVTLTVTRPGVEPWVFVLAIILIIIGSGVVLILITIKNKRKESISTPEKTEGELREDESLKD